MLNTHRLLPGSAALALSGMLFTSQRCGLASAVATLQALRAASTLWKHSMLHDLSHVLKARVHLMRVLEAAGAAGCERARLEYDEAGWQHLEAEETTLRRCCVLAAA